MRPRERLERVEDLLRRHRLLVNPTLLAVGRLHPEEAPPVLKDLQFLAVFHGPRAVGDRSHPVAQKRLLGSDVDIFARRLSP